MASGQRVERGKGLGLTDWDAFSLRGALQAIGIFFVISFMKRAFSNSRRIIIVEGGRQKGKGRARQEKPFIVAQ